MERGTPGSAGTNESLAYIKDALTRMPQKDACRISRLLVEVNQLCRPMEIISQINECKASSHRLPLHLFCRILLKEYKGKIAKEFSIRQDEFLAEHFKNYVFSKIRLATRMCKPRISDKPYNVFPLMVETRERA